METVWIADRKLTMSGWKLFHMLAFVLGASQKRREPKHNERISDNIEFDKYEIGIVEIYEPDIT